MAFGLAIEHLNLLVQQLIHPIAILVFVVLQKFSVLLDDLIWGQIFSGSVELVGVLAFKVLVALVLANVSDLSELLIINFYHELVV